MLENKRTFNAVNANETMRGDLLILEFSFGQFTISCITFWKRFGHVLKPFCRKDRKCITLFKIRIKIVWYLWEIKLYIKSNFITYKHQTTFRFIQFVILDFYNPFRINSYFVLTVCIHDSYRDDYVLILIGYSVLFRSRPFSTSQDLFSRPKPRPWYSRPRPLSLKAKARTSKNCPRVSSRPKPWPRGQQDC